MAKETKNTCSLKVVTPDGRRLHGTAAILHHTSMNGGYNEWLTNYTETQMRKAAENAVKDYISTQGKPKLKVVSKK